MATRAHRYTSLSRVGSVLHILENDNTLCGAASGAVVAAGSIKSYDDVLCCGSCQDILDLRGFASVEDILASPNTRIDLASYLRSRHWQHVRELAIEHYGPACSLCGRDTEINVHHRTYTRIGREALADLTILCRGCHAKYHGKAA